MRYLLKTFGCQQNVADSERIEKTLQNRGMTRAKSYNEANYIVINTCMVRQSAENRVYGLINNLDKIKQKKLKDRETFKIIVTGCMAGLAHKDKTGKYLQRLKNIMPEVDEFITIEEVGFDHVPVRTDLKSAWVPISNGCNNYCTYCVVPYTRGHEVSRPFEEILTECKKLKSRGYRIVTLLGQNVNSYGADLIKKSIPTLFPHLLDEVAKMGFEKVDFMSSNPWDFSNKLIDIIAKNKNITRTIHLPVQSGDDNVLKRMNRRYSAKQYLALIAKLENQISKVKFTTDIIVGFCGETDEEFQNTIDLCGKVNFEKAYISIYSPRPFTKAAKDYQDDVPYKTKKNRWQILEQLINDSNHRTL